MYKIVHKLHPSYCLNLLNLNFEIHSHKTRLASNFHIHNCNTKLRALSKHITDVKLWNMLIPEISSVCSIQVFKNKCRQYLIHWH